MKAHKTNPRTFIRWYLRGVILLLGMFLFGLGLFLWQAYLALGEPGTFLDRAIITTAMVFAAYFCWRQVRSLLGILVEIGGNIEDYAKTLDDQRDDRRQG